MVASTEWPKETLGALFPKNMGNRGQNELSVRQTFRNLCRATSAVEFVAYHWRPSGNFVFRCPEEKTLCEAIEIGERVTGLPCLARRFGSLERANQAVPQGAEVVRGSVKLGVKRVILVALSGPVPADFRATGAVSRRRDGHPRIEILSWPSDEDALCLYDRPGDAGDVGQVTRAVLAKVRTPGNQLYGTGRAMSVIRDLLAGRLRR